MKILSMEVKRLIPQGIFNFGYIQTSNLCIASFYSIEYRQEPLLLRRSSTPTIFSFYFLQQHEPNAIPVDYCRITGFYRRSLDTCSVSKKTPTQLKRLKQECVFPSPESFRHQKQLLSFQAAKKRTYSMLKYFFFFVIVCKGQKSKDKII